MIHILVALQAEARPLVQHLALESLPGGIGGRPAFTGADLRLVITGIGKGGVASAVEGLSSLPRASPAVAWLNIGIAGHRDLPVGEAILAAEVLDSATGRIWRPRPFHDTPCRIGSVRTVETVEERYPTDAAYEMEAASLCLRVPEAVGSGLLQILKVVSDNRDNGTQQVSPALAESLISSQLQLVDWLIAEIRSRLSEMPASGNG